MAEASHVPGNFLMKDNNESDLVKIFGRITFAAVAILILGAILSTLTSSWTILGAFGAIAVLIFSTNLLLL